MKITPKELKMAINTGKVVFGMKETVKLLKKDSIKYVIISKNCPDNEHLKDIENLYHYPGNNVDLGSACGKPFPISVIGIEDPGKANFQDSL